MLGTRSRIAATGSSGYRPATRRPFARPARDRPAQRAASIRDRGSSGLPVTRHGNDERLTSVSLAAGPGQRSSGRGVGEEASLASRQPECALEPGVDLGQQPVGQFADPVFQREAVDGGELGDVDD
jgi:hypothetical protein